MTRDLLATVAKIRPDAHADDLWPKPLQVAERERIMATAVLPVVPPTRRRRTGAVALVAAISAVGGVGVAAAGGLMPKAFTDAYANWLDYPHSSGVNPATAERVASIPGPDGTVFSVFVAHGADGWRCIAPVFESAADAEQPGPVNFTELGDSCVPASNSKTFVDAVGSESFGDGAGFFVDPNGFIYDAAAGAAVRAELHTATGEILPTVLAEGRFYGWGPLPPGSPRPTLVGYDAEGNVIGRR